ncbi:MAG TPA: ABC transporter permease [Puia sp.]|nr:ABC transporter permease [Puia sp.]
MLRNYWLVAIRKLLRYKIHSIINILGLTIGIASCLIIFLLTRFELSYDTFHPNKDRMYRVVATMGHGNVVRNFGFVVVPLPLALRKELVGCDDVAAFYNYSARITVPQTDGREPKIFDKPDRGVPSPLIVTDSQYFDVFHYQWLAGNAATSLNNPFSVVLSEKEMKNYFGPITPDQAIGRTVIYDDSLTTTVTGIVRDWAGNTDVGFRDFIGLSTVRSSFLKNDIDMTAWGVWDYDSQGFIRLAKNVTPEQIERQFPAIVKKYLHFEPGENIKLSLQPLADIHFNSSYEDAYSRKAHKPTLYGLMGIAIFILLLAAINFINLSTAQSLQRTKEIGIRKVLGSRRIDIVFQFLGETVLFTLLAVVLSVLITPIAIYLLHDYLPSGLRLDASWPTLTFLALITVVTALLAGWYPARVIAALLPVLSLKGQATPTLTPNRYVHRGLIVFQFTISLAFIMCTVIVARQLHYVVNTDLGFKTDAILTIHTSGAYPAQDREVLAARIREMPEVDLVSRHMETPQSQRHGGTILIHHGLTEQKITASFDMIDTNYLRLFGIELVAGRPLFPSDTIRELLINETAARALGFDHPRDALGVTLTTGIAGAGGPVVGIIHDFHAQSLHEPIKPFFIGSMRRLERSISFRLKPGARNPEAVHNLLAKVQKLWHATYPNEKFKYSFFDDTIAHLYSRERQISNLLRLAMVIAIAISCMGLLGLATFAAEQRSKEISIRKVLGASVGRIVALLTTTFLWPVALAIVIATPVAWYFMRNWLQSFVYRTTIPWWIFACCGLAAVAIALFTVGFQALRAATANPVEKLRSE